MLLGYLEIERGDGAESLYGPNKKQNRVRVNCNVSFKLSQNNKRIICSVRELRGSLKKELGGQPSTLFYLLIYI